MGLNISGNDSSTPLDNGEVFPGKWVQVPIGSLLVVNFTSDVGHKLDISYSVDGGNTTDSTLTRYFRTGQIFAPQVFKNARPWLKVVATNDSGSNASSMRLHSFLAEGEPLLNIPLDAVIAKDYSAISSRPSDYDDEVQLGRRQGVTGVNAFGHDEDQLISESMKTVWGISSGLTYLTSASTFTIAYNNATDGLGTTGALSLEFDYIDGNNDLQTATHVLGSSGSEATSFSGLGINEVRAVTAGSVKYNTNDITITATTGGTNQAYIQATHGITHQAFFFIPRNHMLLVREIILNGQKTGVGAVPEIEFRGFEIDRTNDVSLEVFQWNLDIANSSSQIIPVRFPISGPALFEMRGETDKDNSYIGARFLARLYRNVDA